MSLKTGKETQAILAILDDVTGGSYFPMLIGETLNAVAITDSLDRFIYINSGFTRMLGYAARDILGRHLSTLFGPRGEEIIAKHRTYAEKGQPYGLEEIVYGHAGQRLWTSFTGNPIQDDGLQHQVTICVITDITDTKVRETLQLRAVDAMARDVSSAEVLSLICREVEAITPDTIVAVNALDAQGRLHPIAAPSLPEACRKVIAEISELDTRSPSWRAASLGESVSVLDLAADLAANPGMGERRIKVFIDSGIRACWALPIPSSDGRILGTITYYFATQRKPDDFEERLSRVLVNLCALALERGRIRDDMRRLTFYDSLTNLPNRSLLLANGDKLLQENRDAGKDGPMAILFVNIDNFRVVSSSFGHCAGDELIRLMATRLTEGRRPGDIVGRVGVNEFALALAGCDERTAAMVADRLLAAVTVPCRVANEDVTPAASIGVALYPDNAYDMEALLDAASAALPPAGSRGDNRCAFFSEEATARARMSLSLQSRLRAAVERGELLLFYQPQVSFDTGRLHGVEALARWNNRDFGVISPGSFIPMAEEAGIIDAISDWVVSEACRQMGEWRRRNVPVPSVSVNLSAPNFRNPALTQRIREHLDSNGLNPADLVLELTESVFLDNTPSVLETLHRAKDMGLKLSLDDFGTGYSSIGYLRNLSVAEIKLDQSFVHDLASNPESRRLSQAVIRLGENLGLTVVVEGVETEEQFSLLKSQGHHILQGYYVSKPLESKELETWLNGVYLAKAFMSVGSSRQ